LVVRTPPDVMTAPVPVRKSLGGVALLFFDVIEKRVGAYAARASATSNAAACGPRRSASSPRLFCRASRTASSTVTARVGPTASCDAVVAGAGGCWAVWPALSDVEGPCSEADTLRPVANTQAITSATATSRKQADICCLKRIAIHSRSED
jgi:hypothetical protein